jgi:hypothetical protein
LGLEKVGNVTGSRVANDLKVLNALDRRGFLKAASLPCLAACGGAFLGAPLATPLFAAPPTEDDSQFVREAKFYEKQPYKKIKCKLCPRECVIDDQERGY